MLRRLLLQYQLLSFFSCYVEHLCITNCESAFDFESTPSYEKVSSRVHPLELIIRKPKTYAGTKLTVMQTSFTPIAMK